jgi:acyl-CoA reductase-like NAD-dependent aldehyde dehydrogenase
LAQQDRAVRAITFGAAGAAGQRYTSLRRLCLHASRYEPIRARPKRAFTGLKVGSPLAADALVGPLIDAHARGHQIGSWELQRRICMNAVAFPVPGREPRHNV